MKIDEILQSICDSFCGDLKSNSICYVDYLKQFQSLLDAKIRRLSIYPSYARKERKKVGINRV